LESESYAPRLASGNVAARKRYISQAGNPRITAEVGNHCFRAPDISIVAEASSVECESENLVGDAVLRSNGCDVRMMVLNRDRSLEVQIFCDTR
jgi:hypothetical protein